MRDLWNKEPAIVLGLLAAIVVVVAGRLGYTEAEADELFAALFVAVGVLTRTQVSPVKRDEDGS